MEVAEINGLFCIYLYFKCEPPQFISSTNYSIDKIRTRDFLYRDSIIIDNINLAINVDNIVGLKNLNISVYPVSNLLNIASVELLKVGDIVSIADNRITTSNGNQSLVEYRKITEIGAGNIYIDTPFSLLNNWSLNGTSTLSTAQSRFGTKSLSCNATTSFARLVLNPSLIVGDIWTVEMFVRLTSQTTTQSVIVSNLANAFRINYIGSTRRFRISLGRGSSYDIANNLSGTTVISANVWYHVAVVKSSTNYLFFVNGILQNTINSTLQIPTYALNNLRIGGEATTMNGFIDEFRLSSINRYSINFTPTATIFSLDERTISLNHFDGVDIGNSDDRVNSEESDNNFTIRTHGYIYKNSVFYLYAYGQNNSSSVILSTRNNEYDTMALLENEVSVMKRLPFYITISQLDNVPHSTLLCGGYYDIHPNILLVSNLSNTNEIITSLGDFLPVYANRIRILITHSHVGTIECGISVGTRSELKNTYLITNVASITSLTIDIPIINLQLISNLSILASTTSYSILLLGYHC